MQWLNTGWVRGAGFTVVIFGVAILAAFGLWKKMRLDYTNEDLFGLITWMIVWGTLGEITGNIIGLRYVGMWIGLLVILGIYCRKKKWNFWEWWDELVPVAAGLSLVEAALLGRWIEMGFLLMGWGGVWLVDKSYRKFRWYKSGKPGFVGLFYLIWLTGGQSVIAFINMHQLYWLSLVPIIAIGVLYYRSGWALEKKVWLKINLKKNQ